MSERHKGDHHIQVDADTAGPDVRLDVTLRPELGNLYVYVNGTEAGSLYFQVKDDQIIVSFGAEDEATRAWEYVHEHSRFDGAGLPVPANGRD